MVSKLDVHDADSIFENVFMELADQYHPEDGFSAGIDGWVARNAYIEQIARKLVNDKKYTKVLDALHEDYNLRRRLEEILEWENYHAESTALDLALIEY